MYTELIQKVISAINADRADLAQFFLSNLLLTSNNEFNEDAKNELMAAVPGSKVVFGEIPGLIGMRAGYFLFEGERYYFA